MDTKIATASARIVEEVTSWRGTAAERGSRGELSLRLGRREIGHLHGNSTAHFGFPKPLWHQLKVAGRIDFHPVFPGRPGPAARRIETGEDVADVIALLQLNYDRISGSAGDG